MLATLLCDHPMPGERLFRPCNLTGREIPSTYCPSLETITVFCGHTWSLCKKALQKWQWGKLCGTTTRPPLCLVHSAIAPETTLIYQGVWLAIDSQKSKNKNMVFGLITGQFKISSLVSSKALQKKIQCPDTRSLYFWCLLPRIPEFTSRWGLHWRSESKTLGSLAKHRI